MYFDHFKDKDRDKIKNFDSLKEVAKCATALAKSMISHRNSI